MIPFLLTLLAVTLMQPARTLPPQFAAPETECAQRCSEGGGKWTKYTIDATHGPAALVECDCSRTTPKGVQTWHGVPAAVSPCNVECPKADGGWKPLTPIPCSTTIQNACS